MTTTFPTTIGPYRIDRELGRGGMGIVFLGHDTRLDRAVAIKALSPEVVASAEQFQRFEREARLLASLSHPNIAAIYGVEESEGARYLILEHVEGESLAERLGRGPLPLADTLDICHQIASGIEAAHESGVIHRDLKPGNVMITPNDVVKVLDFGLAKGKVADSDLGRSPTFPSSPTFPQSPTIAPSPTYHAPTTIPGVVLGTAAYLSPEQARGKPLDRRTDIWSFGCVLYQCLTGRLAFEGETVSDTIARILDRDVDWSRLPGNTPPAIRALLERCLETDARKRLRDMGDARLAFEELKAGRSVAAAPAAATVERAPGKRGLGAKSGAMLGLGIVAVGALALILWGALGLGGGGGRAGRAVTRASVEIPVGLQALQWEIAPDGRTILVLALPRKAAKGEEPQSQIYARRMDQPSFEPIRGTDRASTFMLSPDGKSISFVAASERSTQTQMLKMPIDGSAPPVPIAKVDVALPRHPSWLASGDFLIPSANGREYSRLPSTGGPPSNARPFDAPGFDGSFIFRRPLPGDRGVLLEAISYEGGAYQLGVGVLDLRSGKTKILIRDGGSAEYSPTGHLLFTRGNALLAVPFDLGRLEVKGEPVALLGGLRVVASNGNAEIRLASNGTLLHVLGGNVGQDRRAVVVDPGGKISEWSGERQPFESLVKASPDGSRCAVVIGDAGGIYEIWVSDRGAPVSRRVIAVSGVDAYMPEWSPDGAKLAFNQNGRGNVNGVYVANADGSGAAWRIVKGEEGTPVVPTSWSPDGAQLLCCTRLRSGRADLVVAPVSQPHEVEARRVFGEGPARWSGCFSPDGRMLAYMSNETGQHEAHVCRWEQGGPVGQPILASRNGGNYWLRWSRDGKRLYYESSQNQVASVEISATPRLNASAPKIAWDLDALRTVNDGGSSLFDLLPDGQLLVIQKGEGEDDLTRFDVAFNFFEEMRTKLRKGSKR